MTGNLALKPAPHLSRRWHVVHTKLHGETQAQLGIAALGFDTYLPLETRWVKHARRRTRAKRPLFLRYLFVAFDPARESWGAINATHGVDYLILRDGVMPAAIAEDDFVDNLRRAEHAGAFDLTQDGAAFAPGARVMVEQGAFAGLIAEVRKADSKRRVEIVLQFVHRAVNAVVPASALRLVE